MMYLIGIGCVILIFIMFEYNTCTMLRNKIKQSKSSIDVYLNQRFDLIPNLVECVKGYAQHEQDTLEKIARMRMEYLNQKYKSLKDGEKLNSEFNRLLAISEKMPELKASEQFLKLEKSLIKIESELQAARRIYNGDVTLYNTKIASIPTNIVASMFGFEKATLFEIEEYKKANIKL